MTVLTSYAEWMADLKRAAFTVNAEVMHRSWQLGLRRPRADGAPASSQFVQQLLHKSSHPGATWVD